jgi:NADPH:quinone reductase-like Zn-dependent oxidoreductase
MKAVRFDDYGGIEVLDVREVEDPAAAAGRAIVRVRATGLNAGEIAIREGHLHAIYPATFPSGEGTDLAGEVVAAADDGDPFAAGDAVLGWTDERAAHAELAIELGVAPQRVNTIIDFEAAGRHEGVRTSGTYDVASAETLADMAALVAAGDLEVEIARTYPLEEVRDAYAELGERHTRGKIVLVP